MDIKIQYIGDKLCCRTCMSITPDDMLDIFCKREPPYIIDMITSCTSLKIDKNDMLPKQLCRSCYNQFLAFFEFQKRVQYVDNKLKEMIVVPVKVENSDEQKSGTEVKPEPLYADFHNDSEDDYKDQTYCNDAILILRNENSIQLKEYNCNICLKSFRRRVEYKQHLKSHTEELKQKYKCNTCGVSFEKQFKLERHMDTHDPVLKYTCNLCPKRFKNQATFHAHLVIHESKKKNEQKLLNGKQNYICHICFAVYKYPHSLSGHMRKHKTEGHVLSCNSCGKVFKKLSHLKRHEVSHDFNRPFKCTLCPKSFVEEYLLKEHINKHKGLTPYSCLVCKKSFHVESTLNTHMRIHVNEKSYLCSTCGKQFDSSTNLNQHLKRHAGDKSFACTLCPGRYVSKGELQSHMTIHTGARPFVCDTCGSAFTKPNSLAKHKLRHLGIKPHECDVCEKRFVSKDHLKRHYRIHTGEKPYKCSMCERSFTQSNDLVKHMRAHLGEKLYKCSQCTESFRLKTELRNHIPKHFASTQVTAGILVPEESNIKQENVTKIPKDLDDFVSKQSVLKSSQVKLRSESLNSLSLNLSKGSKGYNI